MLMENKSHAKHRQLALIKPKNILSNNLLPSAITSGSGEFYLDPYDLPSNDAKYLTPEYVAETTPTRNNRTAHLLTSAWLNLISPPEEPKNWGQCNPNFNDEHSDPTEIS